MKLKPIFLIFATLIIGFVLGMLTSAQIRSHKLNPVRVFFSEDRFREGFYRTIQPDAMQKEKIDKVLDKYARMNSDLHNNFRKDLDVMMRDFRKEIDAYLTKDQLVRLKEMDEQRMKMIMQNRKAHENDTFKYGNDRQHFDDGPPRHEGGNETYNHHERDSVPPAR